MLAITSTRIGGLLDYCRLMPHQYSLPIYFVDEEPAAIQLLHLILTDVGSVDDNFVPALPVLTALTRLCVKTGYTDICRTYILRWANRWMRSSWDRLQAEILDVVLFCNDRKTLLDTYQVLILANLPAEEVERADELMQGIPLER